MEAFMSQMRLDKWLADAGAGTRSQVKEYLKKRADQSQRRNGGA